MDERLRWAGKPLVAVAILAVLHAAFSTYEYLSTLKALGRHTSSTTLPTSIFIEALTGLLLFLIGTTLSSAPLQDITYRGELAKRSIGDLDSRMGFSSLSSRNRALFGGDET